MNLLKKCLLSLFFVLTSTAGLAQVDDNTRAKIYFTQAEKLFNQGDFENSKVYLTKAEDALGKPVARTLALHIEIEYNLGNFIAAKALMDDYANDHMEGASSELNDKVFALFIDIEEAAEVAQRKKDVAEEAARKKKQAAEEAQEKAFREMRENSKCLVHSEFQRIAYGGKNYLHVESCFGGEDNGTRYIKVVEDPRGICVFPTQLSGSFARYHFWFQAYDYRGKRLFDYDTSKICGKSGHEMVVKNMPTNFLLVMDPATVDGFLKCLDRETNGYNELGTVYNNITRSCKEVEGTFYSIHGLSS